MTITHCTIVGNTAMTGEPGGGIAGDALSGDLLTITNSIPWGNGPDRLWWNPDNPALPIVMTYCDVQDGTGEAWFDALTCLDEDPLFDAGYRLLWASPCIDSGTDAGVTVDLDGNVCPLLAGFDMGCYEAVPEPATVGVVALGMLLVLKQTRKSMWACSDTTRAGRFPGRRFVLYGFAGRG